MLNFKKVVVVHFYFIFLEMFVQFIGLCLVLKFCLVFILVFVFACVWICVIENSIIYACGGWK